MLGAASAWAEGGAPLGQQRFALVVGNNVGEKPERALRYAEEEVGRVAEILRSSGGFAHVELLRGESRDTLEITLAALRDRMLRARASNQSTLFLFYYSGHGDNDALELGRTRFLLRDLRAYLEALPADVRMAFVDACHSGALTGVKGGRRAPSYQLRIADPGTVRGMAIVTSSTANELSQESDELRGSFFSHHVMSGLRGAADISRDGQVTLSELYQYAFQRTLAHTAANLIGGQHPTYETRMAGTGEVILTRTRPSDAQITFPRESGPTYTVFDERSVVAEIAPSSTHEVYLALPAGRYRVVRRDLGDVREHEVQLLAGEVRTLVPGQMLALRLDPEGQRKKGVSGAADAPPDGVLTDGVRTSADFHGHGLDRGTALSDRNLLGVHAGLGLSTLENTGLLQGLMGVSYLHGRAGFSLRGRLVVSSFSGRLSNVAPTSFVRVAPALDLLFPALHFGRVNLLLGATAGTPYLRQRMPDDSRRDSLGGTVGGLASVFMALSARGGLWLDSNLGVEVQKVDGRLYAQRSASLTLGGTVAF